MILVNEYKPGDNPVLDQWIERVKEAFDKNLTLPQFQAEIKQDLDAATNKAYILNLISNALIIVMNTDERPRDASWVNGLL